MESFKVGTKYETEGFVAEVVKRTAKFVTIKSSFGVNRVKISDCNQKAEAILFKAWLIYATDVFNAEKYSRNSHYNAYCK